MFPEILATVTDTERQNDMEIWKDIPGHEGQYQVSDMGNVRSLDRRVKGPYGSTRLAKGVALQSSPSQHGYPVVNIGRRPQFVHALVAQAFIGDRPKKFDVCHINGDRLDNRLSNLVYASRSDNNRHITDHGRRKLQSDQVLEIRSKTWRHGEKAELERSLGIAHGTIGHILRGRLYAHV